MIIELDYDLATLICPRHSDMERAGFAGCSICWAHIRLKQEIEKFQDRMNYQLKLLDNQIKRVQK